jgi:hypothetical protein
MSATSPWLHVTFTPGLSPIRHRCAVEVTTSGQLTQRLFERGTGQWQLMSPQHEKRLDKAQLEVLRAAVARIDFQRLAARIRQGRDASVFAIEVYPPDSNSMKVEGILDDDYRGYHDFRETFEPALQLWTLLYDFLPTRFMDRA